MATPSYDPIRPGDEDVFAYDFVKELGDLGVISGAVWVCTLSPNTTKVDLVPGSRILSTPIWDDTKTSVMVGNMLDGVTYTLTATIDTSDGRELSYAADVLCVLRASVDETAFTVEQFRLEFPAFADASQYSDEMVSFWINQATVYSPLDQNRWGQFYQLGLRLYVAHNLALERMATIQAMNGAAPIGAGLPNSKSVGGVSVSYDVEFGSETNAGNWSLTIWGSRYIRLAREAGSGPIQL